MCIKYKGIDISTFQKKVDFEKVKGENISFALLRAGYGQYSSQKDDMFEEHYKNAKKAGISVGAYWYSYASTTEQAQAEAQVCAEIIKQKQFEYPVFYDIEENKQANLGKTMCTYMCEAFCDTLEKKGYFVGVYANLNWFTNYLKYSELRKKYQIWLAQYNDEMTFDGDIHIWQYTSNGKATGVNGRVDMNWCYVDYPSIIKPGGFNGFSPSHCSKNESPTIDVFYRVRVEDQWLSEVKNLEGFAGIIGQPITDLAIKVSKGKVKYRVHSEGRWLPWVSGYDINDFYNGYAGNHTPVDAIQVYYYTPDNIRPYQQALYRVSELRKDYFTWQEDTSTHNKMDGYAGNASGIAIDRVQIQIKENT